MRGRAFFVAHSSRFFFVEGIQSVGARPEKVLGIYGQKRQAVAGLKKGDFDARRALDSRISTQYYSAAEMEERTM